MSINCMGVCGPTLHIYYATADWPGSTHDSRVFRNSTLGRMMANGWRPMPNGILLGDSAYSCSDYLITPLMRPVGVAEIAFQDARVKTRQVVERCFGVLKMKFHCLEVELPFKPEKVSLLFL